MRLHADTPSEQRRTALWLYALAAPLLLGSMMALGHGAERPGPLLAVAALLGAGTAWLALRPAPRQADWILPVAVVPAACCGVAYATTGEGGHAYLVALGPPLAWAAVALRGWLVVLTYAACAVSLFAALAARTGPGAAALGTLAIGPFAGLAALAIHQAASGLRRAQADLTRLVARDRAVLEALPDLVAQVDREGRIVAIHGPDRALAGGRPAELVGRRIRDLATPEVARALEDGLARALEAGEPRAVLYEAPVAGALRSYEARFARCGEAEAVVIRRDVTRERAAERQLEVSRRQLALAVDGSHLGYWDWEIGSGRLGYGPIWPELLGYQADEIPALLADWGALVHPDDAARLQAHTVAHLKGLIPGLDCQYRMRARDGRWRWIHTRGRVVERGPDQRALRAAGTHADVTWVREAQERLSRAARLASVSTLVRGLAHEMNNPLASLMANLDYIAEEVGAELSWRGHSGAADPGAELRQALRDACASARRVSDLVGDLRSFTAIGEPPAHPPGPLLAAVEEALRLAQGQLGGAEVRVDVPAGLSVELGHAELLQALAALLMNAGQAATGHRPLHVRVEARAGAPGRIEIRVADDGVGMDAATLAHAFEPFFTTRGVGGGRGLGLSVCLGIVEGAGGEIRLESQPGQGTVAHLDLPAALETAAPRTTPPPGAR